MKALLVTNLFPSSREPTRGVFNLRRFQALARLCEVRVVVPVPAWRRLHHISEWLTVPADCYQGIAATYPTNWTVPRVAQAWQADAMYRSIRPHVLRLRSEFDFDVILGAFAYPDVVAAARLAQDASCPLVALVMGSDVNELSRQPSLRDKISQALLQAKRVIAVSEALKRRVVELGVPADRVIVQRNGVDGSRFDVRDRQEARKRLGLSPEKQLVAFIGNLVHEKGPDVLIKAISQIDASHRTALEVVCIGDGKLKNDLIGAAERLGVSRHIRFVGRRPPDEVPFWLTAADMLCLPSRREGCPNVVLEALASGRPVVASAVGGVPELLNESNGVMVPSEDPAALAGAIVEVLQRNWDPASLRRSIPSLTWDDSGHAFDAALRYAIQAHDDDVR